MFLSTNPATKHFVGGSFADKVVRGEILIPNCLMKLVFEKKKEKDRKTAENPATTIIQQTKV
jgi:hypothetical protein